jgi:hypothetical protein
LKLLFDLLASSLGGANIKSLPNGPLTAANVLLDFDFTLTKTRTHEVLVITKESPYKALQGSKTYFRPNIVRQSVLKGEKFAPNSLPCREITPFLRTNGRGKMPHAADELQ